jgi:hypothetical protein
MYATHTEIPQNKVEYLRTVFSVDSISEVSIDDINSFMVEEEQWYEELYLKEQWQFYYEGAH